MLYPALIAGVACCVALVQSDHAQLRNRDVPLGPVVSPSILNNPKTTPSSSNKKPSAKNGQADKKNTPQETPTGSTIKQE